MFVTSLFPGRGPACFPTVLYVILVLLCIPGVGQGQVQLRFSRVTLNWPQVALFFQVDRDGDTLTDLGAGTFTVEEDGLPVRELDFRRPPPADAPFSTVLVIDKSGSMSGANMEAAKQGALRIISSMDGASDEASVIYAGSSPEIAQSMTRDTALLRVAVDALSPGFSMALWDAIWVAVTELGRMGRHAQQSVLVVTDGPDASSTRTVGEVVEIANLYGIRINCIGIGNAFNHAQLDIIAKLTGGRFVNPPLAALADTCGAIAARMRDGYREYCIHYDAACPDGGIRTIRLSVTEGADSTLSQERTYRAPLDSTAFVPFPVAIGGAEVRAGEEAAVPVALAARLPRSALPPFDCIVRFDSTLLEYHGVRTEPGDILFHAPPVVERVPEGLRISSARGVHAPEAGPLFHLRFRARGPVAVDTLRTTLEVRELSVGNGCLLPADASGALLFIRALPEMHCEAAPTLHLRYDTARAGYFPRRFRYTMRVENTGDAPARDAVFLLHPADGAFTLVEPADPRQTAQPPDVLPGESAEASWLCEFTPCAAADTIAVTSTAAFANHPDLTCAQTVTRPTWQGPLLVASCEAPDTLRFDGATGTYAPDPFVFRCVLRNVGAAGAHAVRATLLLPEDVVLDPPAQPLSRVVSQDPMLPGAQGGTAASLAWTLRWAGSTREWSAVQVGVRIEGIDAAGRAVVANDCDADVFIEGTDPSRADFHFPLLLQGRTQFCAGLRAGLSAGPGYATYRWSTGEETPGISVTESGEYSCVVRTFAGAVGHSDTIRSTVFPVPDKPVITRAGDVLIAPEAHEHWWYRNGLRQEERGRHLLLTEPGRYRVILLTAERCLSPESNAYDVTVLGVNPPSLPGSFALYPNPAPGAFHITLPATCRGAVDILITDLLGRTVHRQRADHLTPAQPLSVVLPAAADGVYLVRVRSGEHSFIRVLNLRR